MKKSETYDHKKVEKKWQNYWEKNKTFISKEDPKREKFYGLIEFPYPSGDGLHVGHIRSNTAMDIIGRKRRMEGYNVLYPIGWDAFGLPTENYAIKTGIHPIKVTKQNTDTFRRQLKALGFAFDWSREINTTDPAYYKWTQWIFLKFLEKGLAYKKKMLINWCPKDKIGLANEEVVDGCCERCGTPVEKREKEQWMLAITKYADRLDKDLDEVNFLEKIKIQQRNWIGKSEGAEIEFQIKNSDKTVKVFTTRPDTLFGVTYVVIAPENDLVKELKPLIKNWVEVDRYIKDVRNKPEMERTAEGKEKTGIELNGVKVINPVNNEEVPVWLADYVLAHYGTGSVMAVPAHDERDYSFATKYKLPIKYVIAPSFILAGADKPRENVETLNRETVDAIIENEKGEFLLMIENTNGVKHIHFVGGGTDSEDEKKALKREIIEETGYTDLEIKEKVGPSLYCFAFRHPKNKNQKTFGGAYHVKLKSSKKEKSEAEEGKHELVWIKKDQVKNMITWPHHLFMWNNFLKSDRSFVDDGKLINSGHFNGMDNTDVKRKITEFAKGKITTTYKLRDWIFSRQHYWGEPIPVIICDECGIVPLKEKDLPLELPMVKKYQPTSTGESPLASISKWVNVKCPKCGGKAKRETDTMPNWAGSSWYYLRYTDPKNSREFADYDKLKYWTPVDWYNGGMEHTTLHLLYSRFWHKFLYDLKLVPTSEPYMKRTSHGLILGEGGEKMSKSRGNVINPDEIVKNLGADALRIYEMFMGPFDQPIAWSSNNIVGSKRFLERVWKLQEKVVEGNFKDSEEVIMHLNLTIKKISDDIESMGFNTAISGMMIFSNLLETQEKISKETYQTFIKILSPFAPHMSEELWQKFGGTKTILNENWPKFDESKLQSSKVKIIVQINGKVRGTVEVSTDSEEGVVEKEAMKQDDIVKWTEGKKILKKIYIKNKIINFVI